MMISFFKNNKILTILLIITFVASILGLVFYFKLDITNKNIIKSNIDIFFKDKDIIKSFFINQSISNILIWILGISIFGIIIVLLLYFLKVFIFSFELCSLISSLGFKSLFSILIYYIPSTIMIIVSFFISYYSILLSIYLFKFLFLKRNYSFNYIIKKYIILFIIFVFTLIISTFIDYINITYLINFN